MGYSRQANVYSVGEYAVRGGILDVYGPEIKYPVRLDFFGTKLEKIRTFDPSSQRSNGSIKDKIKHKEDIQNNRNHLNSLKDKSSAEWKEYATKCMIEIMDNKV